MRKAFGALVLGGVLAGAVAVLPMGSAEAQTYPRVTGSGENMEIDYGPGGQRSMLFGGGRVRISMMDGANVTLMHLDAEFVQQPREGFVPMIIGSGESQQIVYVRQAMIDMIRNARQNMPQR